MTLDGLPVFIRQATPGFKSHDAILVEQQHGRAIRRDGADHGLQGYVVEARHRLGSIDGVGQLVQHLLAAAERE